MRCVVGTVSEVAYRGGRYWLRAAELAVAAERAPHRPWLRPVRLRAPAEPGRWAAAGSASGMERVEQRAALAADGGGGARRCGRRTTWVWLAWCGGQVGRPRRGGAMLGCGGEARTRRR